MTCKIVSADHDLSFKDAVTIMAKNMIGSLVIKNDRGNVVGLLTEREILAHLYRYKKIPDLQCRAVKLAGFTKIPPETTIEEAARRMILSKHRLLVYDNLDQEDERLEGIITASDLVRAFFAASNKNPDLDKVMSKKVAALQDWASINDAVRVLHRRRIGSVIVTTWEGFYEGIFTERDLLNIVLVEEDKLLNKRVGEYCSWFMLTAQSGIRAREAAKLMFANDIKRLPITKDGKVIGIVTARDLVEAYSLPAAH
jgi:predicted transcriptional regulator